MTVLSNLLGDRLGAFVSETNLETGEIYTFYPEAHDNRCCMCWQAPGNGTAVIEVWGAGGSGARLCCCGAGISGNTGAYVKQTVQVESGDFVQGCLGRACGGCSTCFPGCSESSCITICHAGGCSCICAEGGVGGMGMCQTGSPQYCCMLCCGYPGTPIGSSGCGMICNWNRYTRGIAYGPDADEKIDSKISCTHWRHCNPCCWQRHIYYHPTPPNIISDQGSFMMLQAHDYWSNGHSQGSINWDLRMSSALNVGNSSAAPNSFRYFCWGSGRYCGCYETMGRISRIPPAFGGMTGAPCDNVRAQGQKGGNGMVRIRYIPS